MKSSKTGSPTPTCSQARAVRARPPAPKFWQRRQTVSIPKTAVRAARAKSARASRTAACSMLSRWTPRPTAKSRISAILSTRCSSSPTVRGSASTLWTRCICSPPRRSTRFSKRSRSRRSTSSLSSRPPRYTSCRRRFCRAASGLIFTVFRRRQSPTACSMSPVRKRCSSPKRRRC